MADYANPMLLDNVITDNTVGVYLQTGAKLMAGKNMISGNQTNVKAESCLKGDTTASSVRDLWEVMNQLY
jgi:parallel beta-helix repeat protein